MKADKIIYRKLVIADKKDALKVMAICEETPTLNFMGFKEWSCFKETLHGAPGTDVFIEGEAWAIAALRQTMDDRDILPQSVYYIGG